MKNRLVSLGLVLALVLAIIPVGIAANRFSDVDDSAWYATPVDWAVENGITTGTTKDWFDPYSSCTNAEILTFLWRAAGSPEPTVSNKDYKN